MVTPEDWARLRLLNFGVRALNLPVTVACVAGQIRRYDRVAAAQVSSHARREASLDGALDRLLALYSAVIEESASMPRAAGMYETAAARYLLRHATVLKGRASALEPAEPAANGQEALCLEPKADLDALANERRAMQLHVTNLEAQAVAQEAARQLAERREKERAALYLEAKSNIDALANELRETQLREAKALAKAAAQEARARDAERERDYWRREWQLLHESATWKVARSMLQSAPAQVLYPLIERVGRFVRGKRPRRLHR
jgi:hypothetical protein